MENTVPQREHYPVPPQSLPTTIHRKPVPVTADTAVIVISPDLEHEKTPYTNTYPEREPTLASQPPPFQSGSYYTPTTPLRPQHHRNTLLTRLKNRYTALPKLTRILLPTGLLLLLILTLSIALPLTHKHSQNLPLPTSHGGPYTGDLTYYSPGLGACGYTSTSGESIVSISHLVFDAASVGQNPNENPLCGRMIRARRGERSVDLRVVDRCTGCEAADLDTSITVFGELASVQLGRVGVTWAWL